MIPVQTSSGLNYNLMDAWSSNQTIEKSPSLKYHLINNNNNNNINNNNVNSNNNRTNIHLIKSNSINLDANNVETDV
jgi:hypothetical protein